MDGGFDKAVEGEVLTILGGGSGGVEVVEDVAALERGARVGGGGPLFVFRVAMIGTEGLCKDQG